MANSPIIFLDRDGVLNEMHYEQEHGTVDSPMNVDQVRLISGAAKAVAVLHSMGFKIHLVTNQPAASKNKTSVSNLEQVNRFIQQEIEKSGGKIDSIQVCLHTSADDCLCRKPRKGLLERAAALERGGWNRAGSFMVGDGLTDIQAGQAFGVRTVLIAPAKLDWMRFALEKRAVPDYWYETLEDFAYSLQKGDLEQVRILREMKDGTI